MRHWLKIAAGLGVLVAVVIVVRLLPIAEWLSSFQDYVRGLGAVGYVVYALVYALCCVLFIPASILTLGAGAVFGLFAGFGVVIAGAFIGACASFLLARTLLRRRLEERIAAHVKFGALDRAIAREGAKIVLLVRLSPVFPFTYINYAFGLTGVTFRGYALASLSGMLPGTFAFTYVGYAAATAATGEAGWIKTTTQVVGAIATLAVSIFVARLAKRSIAAAGVQAE